MIEVGTRVKIIAKFFSELDLDIIPLWEGTVTEIEPNDELCYYVEELDLWFSKLEVEIIKNEL